MTARQRPLGALEGPALLSRAHPTLPPCELRPRGESRAESRAVESRAVEPRAVSRTLWSRTLLQLLLLLRVHREMQ